MHKGISISLGISLDLLCSQPRTSQYNVDGRHRDNIAPDSLLPIFDGERDQTLLIDDYWFWVMISDQCVNGLLGLQHNFWTMAIKIKLWKLFSITTMLPRFLQQVKLVRKILVIMGVSLQRFDQIWNPWLPKICRQYGLSNCGNNPRRALIPLDANRVLGNRVD